MDLEEAKKLYNEALSMDNDNSIMQSLKLLQNGILRMDSNLINDFLPEILKLKKNTRQCIRVFVAEFCFQSCKIYPQCIHKFLKKIDLQSYIDTLISLISEENMKVQTTTIKASSYVYKKTLEKLSKETETNEENKRLWNSINALKKNILLLSSTNNEFILINILHFMETVIISAAPDSNEEIYVVNFLYKIKGY
jgi:hypothetical protein